MTLCLSPARGFQQCLHPRRVFIRQRRIKVVAVAQVIITTSLMSPV
jgi:hypothetical protein